MLSQQGLHAVGTEPTPAHVREQRWCSFPQRFLEPCLERRPSECGQRSGPLLPPFTDASYVCARPEVDSIPVKASQL